VKTPVFLEEYSRGGKHCQFNKTLPNVNHNKTPEKYHTQHSSTEARYNLDNRFSLQVADAFMHLVAVVIPNPLW